ncbi:MAG: hypothetical protein GYA14_16380, partial [Ignavibacteria bacterium]|nr:hypothetical protein [Ignavibacteria bacterium]
IRDGIEPRIVVASQIISLAEGKVVLVVRINRSWFGPHRVIFKGHDKFYSRNSAGKFPLDTSELRNAFNLSQSLVEKINNFKSSRILDLTSDNTPIPFYDGGKIVLHIIPFESFNPENNIDMDKLKEAQPKMVPMKASGWSPKINLEGILSYSGGQDNRSHSYIQLYRNGIVEAVEGLTLSSTREGKYIPSVGYESMLMQALKSYMGIIKDLGVNPPIAIYLTFIGVKGYKLSSRNIMFDSDEDNVINKDILNLPESIVETYDITPTAILRPIFDLVWNACGFERSFNFNEKGEWIAK